MGEAQHQPTGDALRQACSLEHLCADGSPPGCPCSAGTTVQRCGCDEGMVRCPPPPRSAFTAKRSGERRRSAFTDRGFAPRVRPLSQESSSLPSASGPCIPRSRPRSTPAAAAHVRSSRHELGCARTSLAKTRFVSLAGATGCIRGSARSTHAQIRRAYAPRTQGRATPAGRGGEAGSEDPWHEPHAAPSFLEPYPSAQSSPCDCFAVEKSNDPCALAHRRPGVGCCILLQSRLFEADASLVRNRGRFLTSTISRLCGGRGMDAASQA